MKQSIQLLAITITIASICNAQTDQSPQTLTPAALRCEYLTNPLGIDVRIPRLSWILQSSQRAQKQTAYQILVDDNDEKLKQNKGDLWDTGKVSSDQSVHVAYAGKPLQSQMRCCWKVRVWDKNGTASAWSKPAMWSMGLLNNADWTARWIGADWHGDWRQGTAPPSPYLRKTFHLPSQIHHADVYVAAMGYYELYINGQKISDDVLSPAVCDYSKRALYRTYNVTEYLHKGKNCIALWLSQGWFSKGLPGVVHNGPIARAQLEVVLQNNKRTTIHTNASWRVHPSPITPIGGAISGQHGGERYDVWRQCPGWNQADFNDQNWQQATEFNLPAVKLSAQMVQPNRIRQIIKPITVNELPQQGYLVDMGQHLTGWLELRIKGDKIPGRTVQMDYIDKLLENGKFQTFSQHDEYIVRGKAEEIFRNRFNYHGFRWLSLQGLSKKPEPADVTGYLIHTDYNRAAQFECSNPLLNNIYETVIYTYRCLSLGGYTVDCPHRERLGYGGDNQSSMETALQNFSLGAFFTKWLADWRDAQDPNSGDLPHTAPFTIQAGGGPVWSGICITLPWQVYLQYGDKRILETNYPMMQKWLTFLDSKTRSNILQFYTGIGNSLKQWSFLGDWVPPGRWMQPGERVDAHSTHLFNNCYYIYNLQLASRIANILGKNTDARHYHQKAQIVRKAVHKKFFNPDNNTYANGQQPYLAFPLLVGVVPAEKRPAVMQNLEHTILVDDNGHLNSGMLGTYFMQKLLTRRDRNDLLFEMVSKKTYPGWGYMLEQGATTIWEQWNGEKSQIHNCYLCIGSWFIRAIAGIQPDENTPGFKHFFIKPGLVGDLIFANASYDSIRGKIVSNWRIENDTFHLDVTIPANTTATVYIPTRDIASIRESNHSIARAEGVHLLHRQPDTAILRVQSGHYSFTSNRNNLCR